MYARSTTVLAEQGSIDSGIMHIRDTVLPAVQEMAGCIGLSMLVDRESGRCIATTAWESAEAMQASAEQIQPMRERAAEMLGGMAEVDEWEIAVLHRDHRSHEGSCVRATWLRVEPDQMDRAIDVYKMASLPAMEELEGFCSASLFIDRMSGRAVSSVTYDSMEAMERNREQATSIRAATAKEASGQIMDVCEFELALAHLHVPEMA